MKTATCSSGCGRPVWARGYCAVCYQRAYRAGLFAVARPRRVCTIEGCGQPYYCRGLCQMHDKRRRRHGDPLVVNPPGRPRERRSGEST